MEEIKKDLVSILVPVYNGEKYIDRCLDCIVNQTYKHIELILINDGSNDRTDEIINNRLSKLNIALENVEYIVKENGGVGSAINRGLKYFKGEFLYLYDVDDILLPNAVNDCVSFLKQNIEFSTVQANGYYVTEDSLQSHEKLFFDEDYRILNNDLFTMLIKNQTFNYPGSYMIRSKDWLKANKSREIYESRNGQNMQMLFPVTYKHKAGLLNIPVMKYIIHLQSLSHFDGKDAYDNEINASLKYEDIYIHIIDDLIENRDKDLILNEVKHTFISSRLNIAMKYECRKDIEEYYKELKSNNLLTINDKINYYHHYNMFYCFILKILRRIKMLVE